mmetsp:Transcript_23558/g.40523  ORF Transcript_23558/g.40523 Transcript_23558/m.40523 type:complete len:205 (+) Transcript_23558:264-878(+)
MLVMLPGDEPVLQTVPQGTVCRLIEALDDGHHLGHTVRWWNRSLEFRELCVAVSWVDREYKKRLQLDRHVLRYGVKRCFGCAVAIVPPACVFGDGAVSGANVHNPSNGLSTSQVLYESFGNKERCQSIYLELLQHILLANLAQCLVVEHPSVVDEEMDRLRSHIFLQFHYGGHISEIDLVHFFGDRFQLLRVVQVPDCADDFVA